MLSISDWVSFLSSEKNSNIGNIIGFGAFMLVAFAVIMSVTRDTLLSAIVAGLIAVALIIVYLRTIGLYGRRAKIAGRLLDDIMSGEERDLSKIEEKWKIALVGKRQKSKKE